MEFSLPGQLRGPECGRVMKHAIALRRSLEPWFVDLQHVSIGKLTIVLRVDGSIGSFGTPGVEHIKVESGELCCDLVIPDHNWEEISDKEIMDILQQEVSSAVAICFREHEVAYCPDGLSLAMMQVT